jgi:hypothetical protein
VRATIGKQENRQDAETHNRMPRCTLNRFRLRAWACACVGTFPRTVCLYSCVVDVVMAVVCSVVYRIRSEKQETRNKKQETGNKKQETRNKKQAKQSAMSLVHAITQLSSSSFLPLLHTNGAESLLCSFVLGLLPRTTDNRSSLVRKDSDGHMAWKEAFSPHTTLQCDCNLWRHPRPDRRLKPDQGQ